MLYMVRKIFLYGVSFYIAYNESVENMKKTKSYKVKKNISMFGWRCLKPITFTVEGENTGTSWLVMLVLSPSK